MVEYFQYFTEGFVLGITTGHICLATCGPIYSSFLMQKNQTAFRYFTATLEISLGRFITYIIVGAIAGLLGQQISESYRAYFTVTAYILFSVYLLVSVFRSRKCDSGCALPKWNKFAEWPIVLGIITGINICPSFLLAFSRSFVLSGPVSGMMFFAAFFVGTSIFLIPLSFVGMLGKKKLFRSVARVAAVVVSIWFIFSAFKIAWESMLSPYFDKRPIINLLDETPAFLILSDTSKTGRIAAKLAAEKKGKVFTSDNYTSYRENHYIFTDSATYFKDTSSFRKPGRFTTIINSRYLESTDSLDKVISFLNQYHFRFNYKEGDVFFLR
jgi:sulfite exporter TauE/SafE